MKLKLTPERRESIAEALRGFMPELDEAAVQRALFAIWPPRFKGDVCSNCNVDLKTRPVLTPVHNSARTKAVRDRVNGRTRFTPREEFEAGLPPEKVTRNVHKKPLQLVITARIEGSHGDPKRADVPPVFFRFCLDCLDQVKP